MSSSESRYNKRLKKVYRIGVILNCIKNNRIVILNRSDNVIIDTDNFK